MKKILNILALISIASACTTNVKYDVTLQQNNYQLTHETVVERKINQAASIHSYPLTAVMIC